ncbi:hypothetical protein GCM10023146_39950 [Nocardioides caricicola]
MGHLGTRTSALLDGQLSPEETERAWEHVHGCHACRDLVEREGWVKTRLAGLTFEVAAPSTPDWLKGSLMGACDFAPAGEAYLQPSLDHRRRNVGMVAIGSGAVGAAVMGVLVFGIAPASTPTIERPAPASINQTEQPRPPAATQPTAFARMRR